MIVAQIGRGHSFKKLAAYLTAPKDGQHRALWTATENLATDDPRLAAKIMAYEAGASSRMRQGAVYHAVMSWPEGVTPEAAHQQEAARSLLKQLGLERAQVVMAAHDDNGKAHVHLMVNLVDPEAGRVFADPRAPLNPKKNCLSMTKDKMQAWADEYSREHGLDHLTPKRAEGVARRAEGGPREKAPRLSRAVTGGIDRAARDSAFSRQAEQRAALREKHSAEWTAAKREATQQRAAYKTAFRTAYAKAKAEDRIASRPQWAAVFRAQKAEAAQVDQRAAYARKQAAAARQELRAAREGVTKAQDRAKTILGSLAQRIGLAYTPEAAAFRLENARAGSARAALELAQIELKRAGLKAQQDSERAQLAAVLGQGTFAKAQLATDSMSRADFAAMIQRQANEKARQIEAHNAERDALGMKRYEPKQSRKDDPMSMTDRTARNAFAEARQRAEERRQAPERAEGAKRVMRPALTRGGGSVGAPSTAPAKAEDRSRFSAAELAGAKPSGFEQARARGEARKAEQPAKPRSPRRDFDNER